MTDTCKERKIEITINGINYLLEETIFPEETVDGEYMEPRWYYCIYKMLGDDDGTRIDDIDEIGYKGKRWERMQGGEGRESRAYLLDNAVADAIFKWADTE